MSQCLFQESNNVQIWTYSYSIYRVDYLEKSKNLQVQLNELKTEIEVLKVEEKQTQLDRIHSEMSNKGETKKVTLVKVSALLCCIKMKVRSYLRCWGIG